MRHVVVLALMLVAGAVGCPLIKHGSSSSSSSSTSAPASRSGPASTAPPPYVKVGPDASISSKMVCGTEGQAAIAALLNETTKSVTTPTWKNDTYSCKYVYPSGTMGLAVKELHTKAETDSYVASLQKQYGVKQKFDLGQGAFVTPDGKVVARKDYKVLTVDPTTLPAQFGQPPTTRANIAIGAASALMGCWTGA